MYFSSFLRYSLVLFGREAMGCAKKISGNCSVEHYPNDKTCKECRKFLVKQNRGKNADHYREYDRIRFQKDPRVKARHKLYQQSEKGKAASNKAKRKWLSENIIKRGANVIVGNAVRDGKLNKPKQCSECGAGGRIHGHHDDYAFPLVVRWLCGKCHTAWHKTNGAGKNG